MVHHQSPKNIIINKSMNSSAGDHLLFLPQFCIKQAERQPSNNERSSIIYENNFIDIIVSIFIPITYYHCNTGPSNIIFLKILFAFNSCFFFLLNVLFITSSSASVQTWMPKIMLELNLFSSWRWDWNYQCHKWVVIDLLQFPLAFHHYIFKMD